MNKYTVTFLLPKTKHPFALTNKVADQEIIDKKEEFEKHINEQSSKGYELVSTSNLGYGIWFFWRKN